jgi:hypothetical protein
MSKVLERKYFRKKAVKHFRAGGIVTLKEGGFFEDVPLGQALKSAGETVVKEGKKAGAALYDLGAVPINLGAEFLTGTNPGYSGTKFFNVEGYDPDKAYFMGIETDAAPKTLDEKRQTQKMEQDTEVSGLEKEVQKDPTLIAKLTPKKKTTEDIKISTGSEETDTILNNYLVAQKPGDVVEKSLIDDTPKDPVELATKKQLRTIMDEVAEERKQGSQVNLPLMRLALGLMKGTSYQEGLPGFAEIFAGAGEGALETFIEQEKQRSDADLELMELATKLKISQDEVESRKYAVDKQAELYGLKKYDPKKHQESMSKIQNLSRTKNSILEAMSIIGQAGPQSTFDKIGGDVASVLEAVTGTDTGNQLPAQRLKLIINDLKVAFAKELTRGLSPVSDRDIQRIEKILASFSYTESPAQFNTKLQKMLGIINGQLELEAGQYGYTYQNPESSFGGFTNNSGKTIDEIIAEKNKK